VPYQLRRPNDRAVALLLAVALLFTALIFIIEPILAQPFEMPH
jgi:hypothetical protein